MPYQKRGSAPINVIKLTLDFDTLDRLHAKARERGEDMTRCAYELLQEALGARAAPLPRTGSHTPPELEDRVGAMLDRLNQQPRGNA